MTRETVFILKVVPKDFWGGKKNEVKFYDFQLLTERMENESIIQFSLQTLIYPQKRVNLCLTVVVGHLISVR